MISQSAAATSDLNTKLQEAREIVAQLGGVRLSDIEPHDLEAEQHAREHLEMEPDEMVGEEVMERRKMERMQDMLASLSASGEVDLEAQARPTSEDVKKWEARLGALGTQLGLQTMTWS